MTGSRTGTSRPAGAHSTDTNRRPSWATSQPRLKRRRAGSSSAAPFRPPPMGSLRPLESLVPAHLPRHVVRPVTVEQFPLSVDPLPHLGAPAVGVERAEVAEVAGVPHHVGHERHVPRDLDL